MPPSARPSLRLSAAFALLLGGLAPAAFGAESARPAGPAAATPAPAASAALPSEEECAAFGRNLAQLFSQGDMEGVVRLLNKGVLVSRITTGLGLSAAEARDFGAGLTGSLPASLQKQFDQFNSARYLRVESMDGERRALLRLILKNGSVSYTAFMCEKRANGPVYWTDFYSYVLGDSLSKSVRRSVLPLLSQSKKGFLDKLMSTDSAYVTHVKTIVQVSQLKQQGKTVEAWAASETLPDEVRKDRTVLILRLGLAQALDEKKYLRVIGDWEAAFPGDPTLDFVSMDGDFLRKDYGAAIKHIDSFAKRLGKDAYLDFLAANIYIMMERYDDARARGRAALALEPDLANAYDSLLTVAVKTKNHAETVQLLDELRVAYPRIDLDSIIGDDLYAEFRLSKAYLAWADAQKKKPLGETPTP